jgi:hypothetical protein
MNIINNLFVNVCYCYAVELCTGFYLCKQQWPPALARINTCNGAFVTVSCLDLMRSMIDTLDVKTFHGDLEQMPKSDRAK